MPSTADSAALQTRPSESSKLDLRGARRRALNAGMPAGRRRVIGISAIELRRRNLRNDRPSQVDCVHGRNWCELSSTERRRIIVVEHEPAKTD